MGRYAIDLTELKIVKRDLKLSEIQKSILVGSLLGDGYLELSKNQKSARLQIRHTTKQKQYVFWKHQFFKNWTTKAPRYDKYNDSWVFKTVYHTDLKNFRNNFYLGNVKVIPEKIKNFLKHSLTLAVWFMDDGNGYLKSGGLRISSYCFSEKENKLLIEALQKNFGIETTLYKDRKGYQLYIPAQSARIFYHLIQKHIHPVMQYKFARLNPVETTRWRPALAGMKI